MGGRNQKLDRPFRSALDALKVVEELKGRGVKLHLFDLGGDIAGNGLSKLFLTIAAAFAEAERDLAAEIPAAGKGHSVAAARPRRPNDRERWRRFLPTSKALVVHS